MEDSCHFPAFLCLGFYFSSPFQSFSCVSGVLDMCGDVDFVHVCDVQVIMLFNFGVGVSGRGFSFGCWEHCAEGQYEKGKGHVFMGNEGSCPHITCQMCAH